MQQLQDWLRRQLDEKLAEPNSALGSAIGYMLRHWERLTLFLRQAVAEGFGVGGVGDAAEAVAAQAQGPGEEELAVGAEGGRGEGGGEGLDNGFEGSYHGPQGGFLPGARTV
jgi:hypothetical protein